MQAMNKRLILLAIALFTATRSFCAEPPRLIVQIVVGSMRAEDLGRYDANFGEGGFRRLMQGGTVSSRPPPPSRWPRSRRAPCPRPTA